MTIIENRIIALAGMFQSAHLVWQIARQGLIDQAPFEASLQSILKLDASSTEDVYGGISGVKMGLQILHQHLTEASKRNMEVINYVYGMIFLEQNLQKRPDVLAIIRDSLTKINAQGYAVNHPLTIEPLAQLYLQTFSTFKHRIRVTGEQRFLENPSNANKVRALLLAGIRSTVLWRQKGGNRWQWIFSRRKILQATQHCLECLQKQNPRG